MGETKTPFQIIEDYLLDPMMYAGPERSLEALAALRAQLTESESERHEQARLLGMSGENELRLRAQLTEKDREIERLKAEWVQEREERLDVAREHAEEMLALGDLLSASQAREREAVDKLEWWAEWDRDNPMGEVGLENPEAMAEHLATLTPDDLAPIRELFERKRQEPERVAALESALAAARKALETIYLTLNQPGTPNRAFEDGVQDIARAALERINGEGHEK